MNRIGLLLPLVLLIGFVALALWGLGHDKAAPVVRSGKPVPVFSLPLLAGKGALETGDVKGRWVLVNFFASWCVPCLAEHEFLKTLPAEKLPRIGIGYKDSVENLDRFLKKKGNPYSKVAVDREGQASIDWGVTGVPETFLITPEGMIAAHYSGPLSPEIWQKHFAPLVAAIP